MTPTPGYNSICCTEQAPKQSPDQHVLYIHRPPLSKANCRTRIFAFMSAPLAIKSSTMVVLPLIHATKSGVAFACTETRRLGTSSSHAVKRAGRTAQSNQSKRPNCHHSPYEPSPSSDSSPSSLCHALMQTAMIDSNRSEAPTVLHRQSPPSLCRFQVLKLLPSQPHR